MDVWAYFNYYSNIIDWWHTNKTQYFRDHRFWHKKANQTNRWWILFYDLTAADRAIALLQNNPKVSYTTLNGDRKSGLITLKQKRKGINNSITVEDLGRQLKDDAERPEDVVQTELGQDEVASSHTATSSGKRDIPNNLHLKNGQVLLALAWTTDDSRRKFDMFPEIVFGDATEETNSEERPLYTLCGKDNMNKSFAHTWCLLPSNARWAYSWFFSSWGADSICTWTKKHQQCVNNLIFCYQSSSKSFSLADVTICRLIIKSHTLNTKAKLFLLPVFLYLASLLSIWCGRLVSLSAHFQVNYVGISIVDSYILK